MKVSDAVRARRSVRQFLDKPVPEAVIRRVLDQARWAPSGCNFQPWEAIVLTGAPLQALQASMLAADPVEMREYDWSMPERESRYLGRVQHLGASIYEALDIQRDDTVGRARALRTNTLSFHAPVLMLNFLPRVVGAAQWSDMGLWLQTVMLLFQEEGVDTCLQAYLTVYGEVIKRYVGISDDDYLFFCGMAIGYRDPGADVNAFDRSRVALDEQIRFLGFEDRPE